MKHRDVAKEVEKKNAEMQRQEELAERSAIPEDELDDQDKTRADSFPTSDPPQAP